MMRIIAILLVVLLTGCAAKQSIVGTWEHEMTISVIGMEEHPVEAIKKKKDSSMVVGQLLLKEGKADAFVTCGSTGACLACASRPKERDGRFAPVCFALKGGEIHGKILPIAHRGPSGTARSNRCREGMPLLRLEGLVLMHKEFLYTVLRS